MFPSDGPVEDAVGAERRLYELFRDRPGPDYFVVHSASWHATDEHGRVADGEADFIVIHPDYGVLVLEVKGGGVTRNGVTRRWSTVNARGQRSVIKDPFTQAMRSMHVLLKTLRAARRPGPSRAATGWGTACGCPPSCGPGRAKARCWAWTS